MLLGHDNLMNFYKTNFSMMQHHKYSLTELENLMPWERMLYIDMLQTHLKAEGERIRDLHYQTETQRRSSSGRQ